MINTKTLLFVVVCLCLQGVHSSKDSVVADRLHRAVPVPRFQETTHHVSSEIAHAEAQAALAIIQTYDAKPVVTEEQRMRVMEIAQAHHAIALRQHQRQKELRAAAKAHELNIQRLEKQRDALIAHIHQVAEELDQQKQQQGGGGDEGMPASSSSSTAEPTPSSPESSSSTASTPLGTPESSSSTSTPVPTPDESSSSTASTPPPTPDVSSSSTASTPPPTPDESSSSTASTPPPTPDESSSSTASTPPPTPDESSSSTASTPVPTPDVSSSSTGSAPAPTPQSSSSSASVPVPTPQSSSSSTAGSVPATLESSSSSTGGLVGGNETQTTNVTSSTGPKPKFIPGYVDHDPFADGQVFDSVSGTEVNWPSPISDESDDVDVMATTQPTGGYYTPDILPAAPDTTSYTSSSSTGAQLWTPVDTTTSSIGTNVASVIDWRWKQKLRSQRSANRHSALRPDDEGNVFSLLQTRSSVKTDESEFSKAHLAQEQQDLVAKLNRVDQTKPGWL